MSPTLDDCLLVTWPSIDRRLRVGESLEGELLEHDSLGYEAVRKPVHARFAEVRPRLVLLCRSVSDVVRAVGYARSSGIHLVIRGGGHCFAGRSSTKGIVLDTRRLDSITTADDATVTVGAGARLDRVYAALHRHHRTLPAGCGRTVGIAGLALGGGIGLLGRVHGLTCDRLVGARAVLADGRVVDTDRDHHPDLFWALRGAGGGQFAIVTSLVFDSVAEPIATWFEVHWSRITPARLISSWQVWAPAAPEGLTANLTAPPQRGRRRLTFTPMGGAYNRPSESATAYAHRDQVFLLEHSAPDGDAWVGRSWMIAHEDGSGRVYPNFPDSELDDPLIAYHGANLSRLTAVKHAYDPDRFFDFPQCV